MLPEEKRRAVDLLRRQMAQITAPERKAANKAKNANRRERAKALKESKAPGKRHERDRDNAYLAHTRLQPCIVGPILGGCEGRIDPAHLRFGEPKVGRLNPGLGRKSDDKWVLPLCRKHHKAQHAAGNERKWWSAVGIDPNEACIERFAAWQRLASRTASGEAAAPPPDVSDTGPGRP